MALFLMPFVAAIAAVIVAALMMAERRPEPATVSAGRAKGSRRSA